MTISKPFPLIDRRLKICSVFVLTIRSKCDIIIMNKFMKRSVLFTRSKVFLYYTGYWLLFVAVFAVMFVLLAAAAAGIPFGVMLVIYGTAGLVLKEDVIITQLAPPVMLFGGLSLMFLAAACGFIAVKFGFFVSRRFLAVKRRCDRLRNW